MRFRKNILGVFKKIFLILVNNGLKDPDNIRHKKNVNLINFYSMIIFLYVIMMGCINVIDNNYFFGFVNLFIGFCLLINIVQFGFFKNTRITSGLTLFFLSNILFYTYVTGGKENTGILWTLVFPLIAIQLSGLKKGTIFFIISIIIQIYFKINPLFFDYNAVYENYNSIFFRLILIQIFLYIAAYYFYKNRNEFYNELEEINKQKLHLFINLAHETKTPLTLMSNYLDKYIKKKGLSEELSLIKNNLDKMINDITNYLDIEKLERNQVFYNHDNIVNLSNTIRNISLFFRETAAYKHIKIKLEIPDHIYIKIDPYAIDRILNNLLENAIRYNKENGLIMIKVIDLKEKIVLIVRDTGIGINEEQRKHIFDPFYQSSDEKRNLQGIGMGLSIVNKIINEVNGNIEVFSIINEGTIFKITFNSYKLLEGDKIIEDIKRSAPKFNKTKQTLAKTKYKSDRFNLFVVEDNIEMLVFLQKNLGIKYNFYYALNGKEALEMIPNIPRPNLIISDIMMDGMDGYTFFDNIYSDDRYKSIPFIFLTAKNMDEDRLKGLSKGAIDFISKPFSIDDLSAKIGSIIKYQELQSDIIIKNIGESIYKYLMKQAENTSNISENKIEKINFDVIGKLRSEYDITKKELEIINFLKKGFKYKEVGESLNISINTVRTYIKRIFEKCSVRSTRELLSKIEDI